MFRGRFTREQKTLRRRLLELTHARRLSHLGSTLSAIDIIASVYRVKRPRDRFILSSGHAALALYVVLERHGLLDAQAIGGLRIHPDRDPARHIDLSTGSLGHGLPIALGMALANPARNVFCLCSDGECAEGSIWEALRIAHHATATNLKVVVNANGWGAYDPVPTDRLIRQLEGFGYAVSAVNGHDIPALCRALRTRKRARPRLVVARTTVEQFPFLRGQGAHYHVMSEGDYACALGCLG